MNDAEVDRFVETWGAMGSAWGISASVARVHALLIVSDRPWCIDEIVERLRISKGNVSMCLKELRSWSVVQRVLLPGDRREHFTCARDPWQMFFDIVRERKRREFDPLLVNVRGTLARAEQSPAGVDVERLRRLEQMLGSCDRLADRALGSSDQARGFLSFVLGKM